MGLILIPYSLSFQSVFCIYYSYNPVSAVLQIVMLVFSHSLISFFSFFFPPSAAYSYPIAMLSRAMNPYTNSILEYVSFIYSAGINSSGEKPTGGMLARASKTNSKTNYFDQDGV